MIARRSRFLLLLSVTSAAVTLTVGIALLWPRNAITPENASKIHSGMTLAEVEVILGGPQRDEATGDLEQARSDRSGDSFWLFSRGRGQPHYQAWVTDSFVIHVTFDEDMRVTGSRVLAVQRSAESPLKRLRRLFAL